MLGSHGRSITQAIFTPIARTLVKMRITPNMVTIGGTCLSIVASISLLATGHLWSGSLVVALLLFADSLDGVLARESGQVSCFGAFLDSTLDRLSDGAVFASLLFWIITQTPMGSAHLVSVISGLVSLIVVGTVPYARARAEVVGIVAKLGIAERTDRLLVILVCAFAVGLGASLWILACGFTWVAFASFITVIQRIWFTARELRRREAATNE